MKKSLICYCSILILIFIFPKHGIGQVTFRKGYFIDNHGFRTNCLIKDLDRNKILSQIEYKTDENSSAQKIETNTIHELAIEGLSKFVKATVMIDKSSTDVNNLSPIKEPIWMKEELFLKVLHEGKATLYAYYSAKNTLFFYSVDSSEINQLVYKKYAIDQSNIATNNSFRIQLWQSVRCEELNQNELEQLQYQRNDLEIYFKKFNECNGQVSFQFVEDPEREKFHLKLAPGINSSSFEIWESKNSQLIVDFNQKLTIQFGIEGEYILPINRNKWSLLIEPGFYSINAEKPYLEGVCKLSVNTIEFPVGIRYYVFYNKNVKLFANLLFVPGASIHLNSSVKFEYKYSYKYLDINDLYSFGGGIGLLYKKLSGEIRYYTNRDILSSFRYYYTKYNRISFVIGYRLF